VPNEIKECLSATVEEDFAKRLDKYLKTGLSKPLDKIVFRKSKETLQELVEIYHTDHEGGMGMQAERYIRLKNTHEGEKVYKVKIYQNLTLSTIRSENRHEGSYPVYVSVIGEMIEDGLCKQSYYDTSMPSIFRCRHNRYDDFHHGRYYRNLHMGTRHKVGQEYNHISVLSELDGEVVNPYWLTKDNKQIKFGSEYK
jgi:hypothetical protein